MPRRPDCSRCGELRYSTSSYCKRCAAKAFQKARYKLSWDEIDYIWDSYDGYCESCGEECDTPFMDHDHETGEVRGLICPRCNTGLGVFDDNIELLQAAIEYLGG